MTSLLIVVMWINTDHLANIKLITNANYNLVLKGRGQPCDGTDLDPSFLTLKKVHLNQKSKIR